jgi:hypothetical protein
MSNGDENDYFGNDAEGADEDVEEDDGTTG